MIKTKIHYHLLDLLKVLTLLAIQTLHAWEFVFFQDDFFLQDKSVIYETMTYFGRTFTIGGQILVAIIYFLFGLKNKSRRSLIKIAGFALLGQVALTLAFMDHSGFLQSMEWDIYVFITLSNLLIACVPLSWRTSKAFMLLALAWLLIPTSIWQSTFGEGLIFDILSGRLTARNSGAWAPLPWFFHALLFYLLGSWSRVHLSSLERWHKYETYLWPVVLLACTVHLGAYYHSPMAAHFYSFNFNQPPLIYWSNFIPFFFWMRLSFLTSIQERLTKFSFMRWLSNLMWAKNVGLTYLLAIIYVGIGSEFDQELRNTPYAFDVFYISIMPVAEILARILILLRDGIFSRLWHRKNNDNTVA
jgi:hypothetical protein